MSNINNNEIVFFSIISKIGGLKMNKCPHLCANNVRIYFPPKKIFSLIFKKRIKNLPKN